jgi:iron complex outermembrane receptor protein
VLKNNYIANNYKQTKPNSTYEKIALLLFYLTSVSLCTKRCLGVKRQYQPLPGVNIIEKELKTEFLLILMDRKIKVKEGATLVFSYVGFSKLEKAVTCSDEC